MKSIPIILLVLLFIVAGANAQDFSKNDFEEVVAKIRKTSLHKLTDSEIYEGAIRGVLSKIEEKNSSRNDINANTVLSPRKSKFLKTEIRGEITGIGTLIKYDKDKGEKYPQIIEVLDGGGKDAGLRPGDEILKVNGAVSSKLSDLTELVHQIRGPAGSIVKLSILRNGEVFTKKIKRKIIPFKSVELSYPQKHVGHLKIKYFNKKTFKETQFALSAIKRKKASSCIIDLRGNNGGLFEEGVKTLSLFAKKDSALLKIKRSNGKFDLIKSDLNEKNGDCRWAILVDEYTKSMGEAFTSSFRHLKNATVIGKQTFGKASMETVMELDNGYSIKYTVGQLYDSKGNTWAGKGIIPDIIASPSKNYPENDNVLKLAVSFLTK